MPSSHLGFVCRHTRWARGSPAAVRGADFLSRCQNYFEMFSSHSSTSQNQLKHPKIHELSLPLVRDIRISRGSGTSHFPESLAGCEQCFLPGMCQPPRISAAQLQKLEVMKFLPITSLIHGYDTNLFWTKFSLRLHRKALQSCKVSNTAGSILILNHSVESNLWYSVIPAIMVRKEKTVS